MADIKVYNRIADIGAENWNSCFPAEIESYHYLLATEEAKIEGFKICYVTAWQDDVLLAAMPCFLTDYSLDTTLSAFFRKMLLPLHILFPKMMKLKLACIGSPVTETSFIGFSKSVLVTQQTQLLNKMVQQLELYGAVSGHKLIALKDVDKNELPLWEGVLSALGYQAMNGLPAATLKINFNSIEAYLKNLSSATRKNMRRKLKSAASVKIEYRTNIDDYVDDIMKLYHQTVSRADMKFEELNAGFFSKILYHMPENAFFVLYFAEEELIGANLLLKDKEKLLDKYFFMDGNLGREKNLYFVSWFTNVSYCIEHRIPFYQSGQAACGVKVSLGSVLNERKMYFRHANKFLQTLLKIVAPLLSIPEIEARST